MNEGHTSDCVRARARAWALNQAPLPPCHCLENTAAAGELTTALHNAVAALNTNSFSKRSLALQDLAVTLTVLHEYLPVTRAALDDGAGRQAEGIVLRDVHRRVTAKAKFRDYERTLRKRKGELK